MDRQRMGKGMSSTVKSLKVWCRCRPRVAAGRKKNWEWRMEGLQRRTDKVLPGAPCTDHLTRRDFHGRKLNLADGWVGDAEC